MRRGDVLTVCDRGYGKPRPAVIVQTDALPASMHLSWSAG
jgi:mRNA-degrading endonuclease toxin of MazEF toxin-antitoxin module